MFGSIVYSRIYPTSDEPLIYSLEIIVAIARIATVMVGSSPFGESDVPVMSCRIETSIIGIASESEISSHLIVPTCPARSYSIHIYSADLRGDRSHYYGGDLWNWWDRE
jgi:hypothetical protein